MAGTFLLVFRSRGDFVREEASHILFPRRSLWNNNNTTRELLKFNINQHTLLASNMKILALSFNLALAMLHFPCAVLSAQADDQHTLRGSTNPNGSEIDPKPERKLSSCLDGTMESIGFDVDGNGTPTSAGALAANLWAAQGLTISTLDSSKPAMLFDSANPTGGDEDLGTPDQGMVLIISEDGIQSEPDDSWNGGTIVLEFAEPVYIGSLGYLDCQKPGSVRLFGPSGELIGDERTSPTMGEAETKRLTLEEGNIMKAEIIITGGGAITDIEFCEEGVPETPAPTLSPSTAPSVDPTAAPSTDPSDAPSASPTRVASMAPSASPSVLPSIGPSVAPTAAPSTDPTILPTDGPSSSPVVVLPSRSWTETECRDYVKIEELDHPDPSYKGPGFAIQNLTPWPIEISLWAWVVTGEVPIYVQLVKPGGMFFQYVW